MTASNGTVGVSTTKYVAPWNAVITGVPTGVVEAEICDLSGNCITAIESWGVQTLDVVPTQPGTININAVITGVCPSLESSNRLFPC